MQIRATNDLLLRSVRRLVTHVSELVRSEESLLLLCLLYGNEFAELAEELAHLTWGNGTENAPADVMRPESVFPDLLDSTAATAAVRERHARSVRVGNRVDAGSPAPTRAYLIEFADATPERELLAAGARITASIGELAARRCAVEVHLSSERLPRYQSRIRELGDVLWAR